ncbi:MAG: hypothetical protein RMJ35_12505, partial [Phycisphaerales bacterium]|nr:hypothetical protein [Phycisphaerales bacterium]
ETAGADPMTSEAEPIAFDPQSVSAQIYWESREEGQVWLDDQTPARRIRTQELHTLRYVDPRDSSRVEITIPKEELVVVSRPRI